MNLVTQEVKDAISNNYAEFYEFRTNSAKLGFVKLIKDKVNLGLKEAKEITDYLWTWDLNRFEREFHLPAQRRKKLENLQKNLLAKEFATFLKNNDLTEEEITNKLTTLETEQLEQFFNIFYK